MSLGNNPQTIEELQRQLQAVTAQRDQLGKLLGVDASILSTGTEGSPLQSDFQLPNDGVPNAKSAALARSKSTVSYPSHAVMMVCSQYFRHDAH